MTAPAPPPVEPAAPAWGAVLALAFSVVAILTAEFLPIGLLTPMAESLGVSEGMAGQTVAVTAFAAIFAGLFVTALVGRTDRRLVMLGFSALLIVSNVLAALADDFVTLLVGRVLLGLALGGFWAMTPALAMRLVPRKDVPRALSIIFSAVSVALVIAAPIGSYLGAIIGWRGVFAAAAGVGVLCLIWQAVTLPSLPARAQRRSPTGSFRLLARAGVAVAMLAMFAVFAGNMAVFTYIRPFMEQVAGLGVGGVSTVLLIYCGANFVGASLSPIVMRASLKATLAVVPLVMAALMVALAGFGAHAAAAAVIISAWGFARGMVPVAWSTWVTRHLGDDAENAGGLQVATMQIGNAVGSAAGGVVFDLAGPMATVATGAALFVLTTVLVTLCLPRSDHPGSAP